MAREIKNKVEERLVHRFILEPYRGPSSRVECPSCGKKHCFASYIDIETGLRLDPIFGRCDRVEKCGYFNTPYGKDLNDKPIMIPVKKALKEFQCVESSDISLIRPSTLLESLTLKDNFSKFLLGKFSPEKVMETLIKYKIGESKKWDGATVFWQIDTEYDIRTGKTILYDVDSGKRVKEPFPKITWEHVADKNLTTTPDYNLKQCLFGEHLISDEVMTYNIVEAEKTAVICDIVSDRNDVVWLSVGGIEMINPERFRNLEGKNLVFFPDKGEKAFTKWAEKLEGMSDDFNVRLSSKMEKTDLREGSDLADLILKQI